MAPPATSAHPLDPIDRPIIEALLQVGDPSDEDIVNASRLWVRYRHADRMRLSEDLRAMLTQALSNWGLTTEEVYARALRIWRQPGWRPRSCGDETSDAVGSGADVQS